jgi:REP element-mobilizing transposase RayT
MARKLRVEYEGAIYHVMNRGDRREEIFLDDRDRRKFLETLGETCDRTAWQLEESEEAGGLAASGSAIGRMGHPP